MPSRAALVCAALLSAVVASLAGAQTRDISDELEEIRRVRDIPSLSAAAYRDGELIGAGASGWYSMEHATPVSLQNRYHLGSCSKAMTAALMGSVIESSDLTWETTLHDALPELSRFINEAYRGVTIRDLLGHRSGLAEKLDPALSTLAWSVTGEFEGVQTQRIELAKTALSVAPAVEPKTAFSYSNYAYIIAAVIIEAHAEGSYEDLLRVRIFEPLGMTSAGFGPPGGPGEVVEPLGHSKQDEWTPMEFNEQGFAMDNPPVFNSAGRVHATLTDWGKFVNDFEQGLDGEGQLLTPETYATIAADPENDGYALGWGVNPRPWAGGVAFAHTGSNRVWFCVAWVAPEKNLCMMAATNAATPEAQQATDLAIQEMIGMFTFTPEQIEAASSPERQPESDDD